MPKYKYEGPVLMCGICITQNWKGETTAVSASKAKSNLAYQFKKQNNQIVSSNITLPGKIKMVG